MSHIIQAHITEPADFKGYKVAVMNCGPEKFDFFVSHKERDYIPPIYARIYEHLAELAHQGYLIDNPTIVFTGDRR